MATLGWAGTTVPECSTAVAACVDRLSGPAAMTEFEGMDRFTREDLRSVLAGFGVNAARRAIGTDPSEAIILLASEDYGRVDTDAVALAVMRVLPHTKVWVTEENPAWESEPL